MADTLIAREEAAKLNPIISPVNAQDTISQCASLIRSFGKLVSLASEEMDDDSGLLFLLTDSIAAALSFELGARGETQ